MDVRRMIRRGLVALVLLTACGRQIPTPKLSSHENEPFVIVPSPPPPARVEFVPRLPKEERRGEVWVDGEWEWKGRRWIWRAGGWEVPEPGASYAPPATIRLADGTIAYFPGTWKVPKSDKK
jgi:hypothetical protein